MNNKGSGRLEPMSTEEFSVQESSDAEDTVSSANEKEPKNQSSVDKIISFFRK